ncbi:MAG: hypothetical protein U9N09_07760 [Euryarchaeota archaeon]|nr:hypothetical protein [Euryarchaeota archaeon]
MDAARIRGRADNRALAGRMRRHEPIEASANRGGGGGRLIWYACAGGVAVMPKGIYGIAVCDE